MSPATEIEVTPDQERLLREILADDGKYLSTFVQIPNKQSIRVPFVPTYPQQVILQAMHESERVLIVKAGQLGSTTIVSGVFLKRTITRHDTTSVIVSHEQFLTTRLLHRTQVMYDSIPIFKPDQDHSSSYEKRFPVINSVLYIGTARAQVFGRGEPIHNLLFSEEAFYPEDADTKIIKPSIERVPIGGTVVRESTPNGEQGSFYEEVEKAREGRSLYQLVVLYWWYSLDNVLPRGSKLVLKEDRGKLTYNIDEQQLIAKHHLTEDQIRWRRSRIIALGDMFFQEHLESLDTCFLTVGRAYYDPFQTTEITKGCYKPTGRGSFWRGATVWEHPVKGESYVIGVDPGLAKSSESVATVWKCMPEGPKHVATLAGLIEPEPMAQVCDELGRYYNNAIIVPEANSHGIAFIAEIRKLKYPRLYWRRGVVSGVTSMEIGWMTTGSTKPFMMQELQRQLLYMTTYDAELIRQIRQFRDIGGGKIATNAADDYHDSACLAMVGMVGYIPQSGRGFKGPSGFKW